MRSHLFYKGGSSLFQGILRIAVASLLFGVIPSANKYILLTGMPSECITCLSHAVISIGSMLLVWASGQSLKISFCQACQLLSLGAIGMGGTTFLISKATEIIPVGVATVLHFLYPTIVSVVMIVLFQQKMSPYKAAAIFCSICGMALITNLNDSGSFRWTGVVLALCSSLTYSTYIIANEKGKINELPLAVKLIYTSMGSAATFGIVSFCKGTLMLPASGSAALMLIGVSGLGSLAAFYLITAGIRKIGASVASFVNMLEPVVGVVVSAIAYQEVPTVSMVVGMALVLSAIFLVAMDGWKSSSASKATSKHMPR